MNDRASQEALLTEGYRRRAQITWRYGTTYFWGAAQLPKPQRKDVYAVYALCRLADDIVDLHNGEGSGAPAGSAHVAVDAGTRPHLLPQDDLRLFDVDVERREPTPQWRAFLAYEIERNRALYSFADTRITMLLPRSARCVGTARVLYSQILDQIERKGYDVFASRARVPTWRKAATAARIMVTGLRTLNRQAESYQRRSMAHVTQDAN
jgi:phytoene/squalene synthetase